MTNPELLTNGQAISSEGTSTGERTSVADGLNAMLGHIIEHAKNPPALSIATAYFNVGGFRLIADVLEQLGEVRLLLGSEPIDADVRSTITPLASRASNLTKPELDEALRTHARALAEDRDLLGFGREPDVDTERLIKWLESGTVQVRRLTRDFLHGKTFIVTGVSDGVVAGSSNFTYAGLAKNRELNLGVYQPSLTKRVRGWFDEQWEAAEDYDLAALYRARRVPHDPRQVFLRMLHELYGSDLEADLNTDNELGLSQFQIDGVARARRILTQRRGVIVADEVGLGKTYIAGEIIREATIERRQKVLIIAPATLRDATWEPFLRDRGIPAEVLSYEQLVQEFNRNPSLSISALGQYAMIVVDEAHHLRNSGTQRSDAIRHVLGGSVPKDLVLLTATPVNNSLLDLQTLVGYISSSDAEFADIGIPSVNRYISAAMAVDPDDLTGAHLFELIDAITVRRTRHFIQTQYPDSRVGGTPIVFPQSRLDTIRYSLDQVLPDFFGQLANALGAKEEDPGCLTDRQSARHGDPESARDDVLTMARYVPSRYLLGRDEEAQYQVQNAGLLKSALLKRFESSAYAFKRTVETMIASQDHFLDALDQGYVLIGEALRGWVATDGDDVAEFVADLDEGDSDSVSPASQYDVDQLRIAVENDRALLQHFANSVATVHWSADPKIAALADTLAKIASDARVHGLTERDRRDRRKVLLFTYFADTAEYVHNALSELVQSDDRLADYRGRIVVVTGGDKSGKQDAIVGFSPRTAGPLGADSPDSADLYDLAVATDVLAEGVNLQQAGQIINYDLPWNPMRLVQRHGRIDRIGTAHKTIHLRSFFPDQELETLLRLEERIQVKLKTAGAAFGASSVIAGVEAVERVHAETREEIERLAAEDVAAFQSMSASATASSEEFQRRLAKAFASTETKQAVLALPFGAGTCLHRPGAVPGVAFCIKIADDPRPRFRYVSFERSQTDPVVDVGGDFNIQRTGDDYVIRHVDGKAHMDRSTLVSLLQADPGEPPLEPTLPEPLLDAVYRAWPLAREDVLDEWNEQADPSSSRLPIPKVMRDAAELVLTHGGSQEYQTKLEERLRQNVEPRYQREIRTVMREHSSDPAQAVIELKKAADELRLKAPVRPPLPPEIELEDVRLIAWVAVHG